MLADAVVHTTGINVQATIAIVASVVAILSVVFGIFAKLIGNQITDAINKFRIEVINQLDTRLTTLETMAKITQKRQQKEDDD